MVSTEFTRIRIIKLNVAIKREVGMLPVSVQHTYLPLFIP